MNKINLSGSIGNYKFKSPFLNASGIHCWKKQDLNELLDNSYTGGVITKSTTLHERTGNPSPRYFKFHNGSINSMGLPSYGLTYYLQYVSNLHSHKPVILSIAGTSAKEIIKILRRVQNYHYNGLVELNLSCPNLVGKSQIAYNFHDTLSLLNQIFMFYKKPLGVKLPPYLDLADLDKIASIINKFPLKFVNVINSLGNGLWVDITTESTVIKPKQGFGGIGGHTILPIALANVRALHQRLNTSIKVIGTGGIQTGADVFAHILCGAELVSVGTQLQVEGPQVFQRLTKELIRIMQSKGYNSLSDFRGKLKTI